MRSPVLRLHAEDLIVDSFAGGGGASLGIEWALGRSPDIAVNHDPEAIAMHAANHPTSRHLCGDVWDVDPKSVCGGRPVALAWFSPDCKHFSKAKGGKPVEKKIRGLAWVVIRWAKAVKPRVILLENVEEFQEWGPLLEDGRPDRTKAGFTFRRWRAQLEGAGYRVELRELRASDYGAPTSRRRLFIIARSDGLPIVWPAATHGPHGEPFRTAADCIEWVLPCPSIFERKKSLAENTLRRIARGIKRYVIDAAEPFIVPVTHAGDARSHAVTEPMRTITGAHRGEHALIEPFIVPMQHINRLTPVDQPLQTVTTQGNKFNLVVPTLIQQSWGEREGQAPRCLDIHKPLGTIVAQGIKHALVSAFLAKHYGGVVGSPLPAPIGTVTSVDHHSLVASHMLKLHGTCKDGQPLNIPAPTIRAEGTHLAEVRAFLMRYNGQAGDPQLGLPLGTVTTKDRFGLVTVAGEQYAIADIGMRMLVPRELFRAQGFPDTYKIEVEHEGKTLSKGSQVRMAGNSVCPPIAAAIVRANFAVQAGGVAEDVA